MARDEDGGSSVDVQDQLIEMSPRRGWAVFAVLAAVAGLTILDVSKVGIALPAIESSLGGGDRSVQLMLVGYTVAYALTLVPSGRLGDTFSRRRLFLIGTTVFAIASVWCALAPTITVLVAGRLVQGVGAGTLMPQVLGLIQRIFPPGQRARPLAALAAIMSATSMFGPVIAGLVMQAVGTPDSWRALFWIDAAVGVVVVPLAYWLVREPPTEHRRGFDGVGLVLLVPAVVLVVYPLSSISEVGSGSVRLVGLFVLGLIAAAAFVVHEVRRAKRGGEALVDPALFQFPHFSRGVLIAGMLYASGTGGTLVVTLLLEEVAHQTALRTALWMLPAAVLTVTGARIAGRLTATRTYGLMGVGMTLSLVGLVGSAIAVSALPSAHVPLAICVTFPITAFGTSLVGAPNQARTLHHIPPYRASVAGSIIQFSQRFGSAIGLGVAIELYGSLFSRSVPWSGLPRLGPTVALAAVALFTATALVVSLLDRGRPAPRVGPRDVGRASQEVTGRSSQSAAGAVQ